MLRIFGKYEKKLNFLKKVAETGIKKLISLTLETMQKFILKIKEPWCRKTKIKNTQKLEKNW